MDEIDTASLQSRQCQLTPAPSQVIERANLDVCSIALQHEREAGSNEAGTARLTITVVGR